MAIPHLVVSDDRIADFCRRWKITEMSVFGSVVREDFRPDIDVTLDEYLRDRKLQLVSGIQRRL